MTWNSRSVRVLDSLEDSASLSRRLDESRMLREMENSSALAALSGTRAIDVLESSGRTILQEIGSYVDQTVQRTRTSLANQERLIRSLSGLSGRKAVAVRRALDRMPEDQRLWILLAAILERSNRYGEAIEAVADLPSASRGVSPRARYAEWPSLGVRASHASLTAQATEAMPALQSALTTGGDAG